MFARIGNLPRDYAWGSTTAIAELLGTEPSGAPEAELWLGAHPGDPSDLVEPGHAAADLAELIADDPATLLGPGRTGLPYLLKVLAAGGPLSLQAHPTIAQAEAGYAREDAAGVPLDAPHRNYKDRLHKPELIVALSDTFTALSGFRLEAGLAATLAALTAAGADVAPLEAKLAESLESAVGWLLAGGDAIDALVASVTAAAAVAEPTGVAEVDDSIATVRLLAAHYPGDAGIVTSLLLNTLVLRRGEALYLPAGNIHAYLDGLGIELMAASDNVLRGGLTPKHVDVPELLDVLRFEQLPPPRLAALEPAEGVAVFAPDVPDFALVRFTTSDAEEHAWPIDGAAIALCTEGRWELAGETDAVVLERGDAVFVGADERVLTVRGDGELFLATEGLAAR